jgi:citrate synthase
MEEGVRIKNTGLRGVTLADTKISFVDGEKGRLIYRGYDINELTEKSTFEEVAYLLLYENLPKKDDLLVFDRKLREKRGLPKNIMNAMSELDKSTQPMIVLQAITALLYPCDRFDNLQNKKSLLEDSINLIAKFPTIITSWNRIRNENEAILPKEDLSHAANFLYMLNHEAPSEVVARILDVCLILHADHTFNASTFAAREVASTRANLHSCVSAAVGALSGELHGGANLKVFEAFKEIGGVGSVEEYVKTKFDSQERIMGMGHAVYNTLDPRARILAKIARDSESPLYDVATKVMEKTQKEFKKRHDQLIYPNVDFYSGIVYDKIGVPADFFTTIFAASRVSGWCAHIIEEKLAEAQPKPILYRPKAEYIGEYCGRMECEYLPINKR